MYVRTARQLTLPSAGKAHHHLCDETPLRPSSSKTQTQTLIIFQNKKNMTKAVTFISHIVVAYKSPPCYSVFYEAHFVNWRPILYWRRQLSSVLYIGGHIFDPDDQSTNIWPSFKHGEHEWNITTCSYVLIIIGVFILEHLLLCPLIKSIPHFQLHS